MRQGVFPPNEDIRHPRVPARRRGLDRDGTRCLVQRGGESVPPALDRLDGPLAIRAVSKRGARLVDGGREHCLDDLGVAPEAVDQLPPGDHTLALTNQVDEEIQYLGLNLQGPAAPQQLQALVVDAVLAESVYHASARREPGPDLHRPAAALQAARPLRSHPLRSHCTHREIPAKNGSGGGPRALPALAMSGEGVSFFVFHVVWITRVK